MRSWDSMASSAIQSNTPAMFQVLYRRRRVVADIGSGARIAAAVG